MQNINLINNVEMPILGLGVYQIDDLELCEQTVSDALEIGCRSIDTAAAYMNEEAVGNAIKLSGIKREDLFITTKLWIQDHGYEKTKKAFELSLKKLRLDYLDLYLIHQPFGDYYGAWRAIEELYKDGKIKAIGVSNFYPDRLVDLISHSEIAPMVNQIETNPFFQREDYQKILKENGVQIMSWAPFAEGKNDLFKNEILSEIGKKYDKSIAQVILRWLIQRGVVVIPKSIHKDRLKQNFEVFNFELTNEDMQNIKMLDKGESQFFSHTDYETAKWLTNVQFDI